MKKIIKTSIGVLAIALLTATSCKTETPEPTPEKKGNIEVNFKLYNGTVPMAWDEVIAIGGVNEFRMEFFKFYISNMYAVNTDGSKQKLVDVILPDASSADGMTFTFPVAIGSYDKIEMGVGLDTLLNASDPVQFAADEPLSSSQAMYWSWADKYRFTRIDGRANENDTIGSPTDILVAYHPGADEFLRVKEMVNPFEITEGNTTQFNIKLDFSIVFNGPAGTIHIPTEPQTHTTPETYTLATKFTDNFAASFSPM